MNALIHSLDTVFAKKAPHMPAGLKEFIVKIAPYAAILNLIVLLVAIFALIPLMLGMGVLTMYGAYASIPWLIVALIFVIARAVLQLIAVPGLFKRTMKGWNFSFYSLIVSLIGTLIGLHIVSFIISGLIGLYVMFQIRSYYMGTAVAGSAPAPTPTPTPTPTPSQM